MGIRERVAPLFVALAASSALGGSAATGCNGSPPKEPPIAPPKTPGPRLEEVWGIADHNAYWVDRGVPNDAFASGVQERLVDQLLGDGARSVEIDIHKDRDNAHHWRVYHTEPGNSVCATFADCLAMLRTYHDALPRHEPTLVVLELKEIVDPNFDATHTLEDLDAELRAGLGEALYTPGDQLARCAALGLPVTRLGACVTRARWPAASDLRGKFIVAVMGNWDVVANASADWVYFATGGEALVPLDSLVRKRAAFPMGSTWKLPYAKLPDTVKEKVTEVEVDNAMAETAIWQVEDTSDPLLAPAVGKGHVVRIDNANTTDDQAARVALGVTFLQTDTPWIAYQDAGIAARLRSYRQGVDPALLVEPGERVGLLGTEALHVTFAYRTRPEGAKTRLAATVSSGHAADRQGCLRAESALPPRASISVCRARLDHPKTPDNQDIAYAATVCDGGTCTTQVLGGVDQRFGDRLAIDVANAGGMGCATILGATDIPAITKAADAGGVRLGAIGAPLCVHAPLVRIGYAISNAETVPGYFFRGRESDDGGPEQPLEASDFEGVVSEPASPISQEADKPASSSLVDATTG